MIGPPTALFEVPALNGASEQVSRKVPVVTPRDLASEILTSLRSSIRIMPRSRLPLQTTYARGRVEGLPLNRDHYPLDAIPTGGYGPLVSPARGDRWSGGQSSADERGS